MGKSFVYNTGSAEDSKKKEELWCDFGVFIDGTLNNKKNTSLRRKYRQEDENSVLTKEKKDADLEIEKEDYESFKETGLIRIPDHIDSLKFDEEEYKAYLLGVYRSDFDKAGTDNSYSNDDTNVTRMWKCCNEEYAIYVEGMGTADKEYDSQDGFAFGSGQTGIRARVRLACKRIADRIKDAKDNKNGDAKVTQITLDVFGFSRGAASARNFVHEVTKWAYKTQEIEIPDGYEFYEVRGERRTKKKYRKALGDADGLEIDPSLLIDGKLPRLGHLGYSLLENKGITPEELENLQVIIRFVGVYDTVSSYYEMGPLGAYDPYGKLEDDGKVGKLAKEAWKTHFTNDEEELGLQELGESNKFQKMVHFTAQDEHRKNFALTRVAGANQPNAHGSAKIIEKNFPGVHCDIGGAYENEATEYIDEIGTNTADENYTSIMSYITSFISSKGLIALKQDLIQQHWYKEEELNIIREVESHKWLGLENVKIPFYLKLTGTRIGLKKEYSYIPLHFMEEFCRETAMDKIFLDSTEMKYPLTRDPFLEKVKKSLHLYVFGDAPEWEFISDAQLQKEEQEREEIGREMAKNKEESLEPDVELPGISIIDTEEEPIQVQLPEIKIDNLNKQTTLRKLRHEYLHWSSNRDWFGMEPNNNRKRVEYPKK
jgi:hypothetical protein